MIIYDEEKIYTKLVYRQELVNTVTIEQFIMPSSFTDEECEEKIFINTLEADNIVSKNIISLEEYEKQKEKENEL